MNLLTLDITDTIDWDALRQTEGVSIPANLRESYDVMLGERLYASYLTYETAHAVAAELRNFNCNNISVQQS